MGKQIIRKDADTNMIQPYGNVSLCSPATGILVETGLESQSKVNVVDVLRSKGYKRVIQIVRSFAKNICKSYSNTRTSDWSPMCNSGEEGRLKLGNICLNCQFLDKGGYDEAIQTAADKFATELVHIQPFGVEPSNRVSLQ